MDENGIPFYSPNGVVQGSPLSPHLFNIYAEMFTKALMSQISFEVQIFMFADDTAYSIESVYKDTREDCP